MDDEEYATLEMSLAMPDCDTCLIPMKPTLKEWKCPSCMAVKAYA
jgi:hypothetical protein